MAGEARGMARNRVYVYLGEGACEKNAEVVLTALQHHLDDQYNVCHITPEETIDGSWKKSAALFVIGGGYDLGYISALGDRGTMVIKDYVQSGGAYLGLCAGSYFGCDYIEFDKNGPQEVCGERILKFFPGLCVGPVWGPYSYMSESGSRAVLIDYWDKGEQSKPITLHAYFNGGGMFLFYQDEFISVKRIADKEPKHSDDLDDRPEEGTHTLGLIRSGTKKGDAFNDVVTELSKTLPSIKCDKETKTRGNGSENHHTITAVSYNQEKTDNREESHCKLESKSDTEKMEGRNVIELDRNSLDEKVQVLAVYCEVEGHPAAIVKCRVGKGVAVLSSPHIEYDSGSLNAQDKGIKKIIPTLVDCDHHQQFCFKSMLAHLGLKLSH